MANYVSSHAFTVDRESRVYRFQTIDGTLIVHRDTFLHAVQTYQEQFRMSRRAALHRAIKVQYWCEDVDANELILVSRPARSR